MGWRVVAVRSRAKLDYKMNYLVCRNDNGVSKIFIDEIGMLIVESTAVSLTAVLLNELIEKNVKIVFCDSKRNPSGEIIPYYGSHDTSLKINNQIAWTDSAKEEIWSDIITRKIENQMETLKHYNFEDYFLLEKYSREVELNDVTNREGHAAKVYFNSIFGKDFKRDDENNINAALNYGYAILLSAINRAIVSMGYITQLGIFHRNRFNDFNLGSDIIEPIRFIVDNEVIKMNHSTFSTKEKDNLKNLMNKEIQVDGTNQTLLNGIEIYTRSVVEALNKSDSSIIKYISCEL